MASPSSKSLVPCDTAASLFAAQSEKILQVEEVAEVQEIKRMASEEKLIEKAAPMASEPQVEVLVQKTSSADGSNQEPESAGADGALENEET